MTLSPESVLEEVAQDAKPGTRFSVARVRLLLDAAKQLFEEGKRLRAKVAELAQDFEDAKKGIVRRKLPKERSGTTAHFMIKGGERDTDVYITTNTYDDGALGEVFLIVGSQGSLVRGAFDCIGLLFSIAIQHGVPLKLLTSKLRNTQFEPRGFTGNQEFPAVSSVLDLTATYLDKRFGGAV